MTTYSTGETVHADPTPPADPDRLRADIDQTRGRLAANVDTLGHAVSPSEVAHRTLGKAKGRLGSVRDSIMGSAQDLASTGSDSAHQAAEAATEMPQRAVQQARGNPLVAGAVALGLGWIVGSLIPASSREQELAASAREQAQPVLDEARSMAQETAENLREPASQAVGSVKDAAATAAQEVRDEGADRAQSLRDSAKDASPGS